jgi:hypothetical protein
MDSMITAAARALAAGDPLGALQRVALRGDAPALALRGIAMAQLGEFRRARLLLRRATRAFGPKEVLARARCVIAESEIALVSRDLRRSVRTLVAARTLLEARGDRLNGAHARHVEVRRLLLLGRPAEAQTLLDELDPAILPPASRAAHELTVAGIAVRRLRAGVAHAALARAELAARESGIPGLMGEVTRAQRALATPVARLIAGGAARLLLLDEVEALNTSGALIIDACRHGVRDAHSREVSLVRRPLLFSLLRALGEAWPRDVTREALVALAFRGRRADESHRVRLRVEMARLRRLLHGLARISATAGGYQLAPARARAVLVLARPVEDKHAAVLAFLLDGESWSSSALALALGRSQRSVQRSLDALAATGKVQSLGRGRTRRWTAPPLPGFTTTLLLPLSVPVA